MLPLRGDIRSCFRECCLNKKLVGAARKRDDSANILPVIGGVDHISDLLPTGCVQGVLFEQAEGEGRGRRRRKSRCRRVRPGARLAWLR